MFPNVSQTQTFACGTNWREIRSLIQEPETASDLKMKSVVFDRPRTLRQMYPAQTSSSAQHGVGFCPDNKN